MEIDYRILKDKLAEKGMFVLTLSSILLVIAMAIGLYLKSAPILHQYHLWDLLTESNWKPMQGKFGFLPFLAGTFWCTAVAIIIALPISLFMAVYLTEYANTVVRRYVYPLLDILAGLPSVIYGVWGTLLIVPWIAKFVAPLFSGNNSGYTVLTGGIVLSVMILPLLISLFMELFSNVPRELRDASLSLGATVWQTTKFVVLRKAAPGMIAAIVLALSRTLGETIAVLMVCGNVPVVPGSLLDACYPIPALIANNYGEMLSIPMYESALMFAAFLLFFVIVILNLGSRIVLRRIKNT
ncbi:MAG: phosphate ABC transporter permease subunit PstC [Prevotella sp.]|jgi:phosphate transport system permease protein|uniref:Phosphate transport system permease protein n=1 Tax=Segatella cerevisiae TaxID=2053716 RepID=A0ABT1BXL0_9BACT|nr:phosphate ABC transporter permease subunit PstC [Segatella cerevisiae]MCH3994606.1 phosphate ABC transporter permease subunit PstC [Prevotella sp.]MCI1247237.1 phosphate ABC transporter permease subunit PstC [Prevotella sp.]MCO6025460.1 phosphate ABC transporter permease subunit PstC [Segatella cerevisiae]